MRHLMLSAVLLTLLGGAVSAQDVYSAADGVSLPVVVKQMKPSYTKAAMTARIEGEVVLDVVVQADGTVGTVAVVQSLDTTTGLDEQAVKAMKEWAFKPGTKDDKPVAVRVSVQMRFSLR